MSMKILKTLEKVIEERDVSTDVADFLRSILQFECFENTYRYKAKYKEVLDGVVDQAK